MATLNVQDDYGAAGDGSTDDTSAVQSAFDAASAGDTVYFPAGTYAVYGSGRIIEVYSPDDLTVEGDGENSVLQFGGGNGGSAYLLFSLGSGMSGFEMHDMVIDGNRGATDGSPDYAHNVRMEDNESGQSYHFENVLVERSYSTGISCRAPNTSFRYCTFRNNGDHGLSYRDNGATDPGLTVEYCLTEENSAIQSGFYGFDHATGHIRVSDSVIQNQNGGGCKTSQNGEIDARHTRTRMKDNSGHAYLSTSGESGSLTFEDCVCEGNGDTLRLSYIDYYIVGDLVVTGSGSEGIHITSDGNIASADDIWTSHNDNYGIYGGPGSVSTHHHYNNGSGPYGGSGTSFDTVVEEERTDIDTVPSASEVGAWSEADSLTVSTEPASTIGETAANMNGNLDSLGDETEVDVYFEWGEEDAGFTESTTPVTKSSTGSFTEQVTGLDSATTYQYRAVADGIEESDAGSTVTFTTDVEITDETWWTDFSDETVGNMPSGWSEEWGTDGVFDVIDTNPVEGNRTVRHQSKTSGENDGISYDAPGNTSEVNVLGLVYVPAHGASNTGAFARVTVRGDEESGTNIGMVVDIYDVDESDAFAAEWRMVEYPYDNHTTWTDPVPQEDTWYLVRLDADGSTFRAKTWEYGENEPSSWNAEVDAPDVPDVGWVGWSQYGEHESWLDFFSVGTGSDMAPLPSEVGDPTTITTDFSEYL